MKHKLAADGIARILIAGSTFSVLQHLHARQRETASIGMSSGEVDVREYERQVKQEKQLIRRVSRRLEDNSKARQALHSVEMPLPSCLDNQRSILATSTNHTRSVDYGANRVQEFSSTKNAFRAASPAAAKSILVYDFVVIGNGTAGRTAVQTLQKQCPGAKVAIVDPLRAPVGQKYQSLGGKDGGKDNVATASNLHYYSLRASSLCPRTRRVELRNSTIRYDTMGEESNDCLAIQYRYGVLVATGARGAPPPHYLIDETIKDRILELRPTILTVQASQQEESELPQKYRPVEPSETVRRRVLSAASRGQRIGVLGSGWEALDLVVGSALVSRKGARPVLIFGSPAPLNHILPAYLSAAVTKRLAAKHVEVHSRTLVRYVAPEQGKDKVTRSGHDDPRNDQLALSKLQLYTTKTYDYLETDTSTLDHLVVAPETSGHCGTAALPTSEVPPHLCPTNKGRSWYQTWSFLSLPPPLESSIEGDLPTNASGLACYQDDGRIAVNAELCACTGVYAAGSVAKYANSLSGHADVAGVGVEDGSEAGFTAAMNMSQAYRLAARATRTMSLVKIDPKVLSPLTKDPIPVFRSDVRSNGSRSSLKQFGIQALCIGNCDNERFMSHAVWWTNQSAQKRLMRMIEGEEIDESKTDSTSRPSEVMEAKRKELLRRRKSIQDALKPVYGIGCIYYMDVTGKIQGIMTWGLPYTTTNTADPNQTSYKPLNDKLVRYIKNIIRTNGGFGSLESESDQLRMSQFLTDTSRHIVALALAGYGSHDTNEEDGRAHQLDGELEAFPKPLHRFTEFRPPNVRSWSVLKRKDGGQNAHGILGEGLFVRYEEAVEDAPIAKPDMKNNVGFAAAKALALYDWNVWEQKERRWEENEQRARPPKEEPLWQRKGGLEKHTSLSERLVAAYNAAIHSGRGK